MADGGTREQRAFIGSFTAAGGPGVLTAAVDRGSGALTLLSAVDGVPDPSYLALSPAHDMLYAVSETADGAVAAYRVDGDETKPAGPLVSVGGSGPTHLSVFAGHVLTANYGSGSVTALPVRDDGTLVGAASSVLQHKGRGPHTRRQQSPHAHQVQPDPSGRWAVSVDLGTDSVRVCALDGGRLHAAPRDRAAPRLRAPSPGLPPPWRTRVRAQRTRPHGHRLPLERPGRLSAPRRGDAGALGGPGR